MKNSASTPPPPLACVPLICLWAALALAMSRDGSSGGTIRMCVITEDGVQRHFVPGNELPRFWEGQEVLGEAKKLVRTPAGVPMAVEV